jgi:16S rRNA (cytosine1402-N4)-methyltransferase
MIIHIPVLLEESIIGLSPERGGNYLDVTFGQGGHTRTLLERYQGITLYALDWNLDTIEKNAPALKVLYQERFNPIWGSFALLYRIVKKHDLPKFDGILADFGTTTEQLVEGEGFSFYNETFLDMRMSTAHYKVTAAEILNSASVKELEYIFSTFGEEPYSKKIAQTIVSKRAEEPIKTTKQLALLVEKIVGWKKKGIHPATKIFQALRIAVNHELDNIKSFLPVASDALNIGGRLVCITFHSLEDRIVKQFMIQKEREGNYKVITKKAIQPSEEEVSKNKPSRSAKLRILERIS